MVRLRVPRWKSRVKWRGKQGQRRNQLNIIVGVKASPGRRANRRHHEQRKQRYPLRLHACPETSVISLPKRRTDEQRQASAQECERSKERNGPIERIVENALLPEYNDGDSQRPKETGAKHSNLSDRSALAQAATCAIARKEQIDTERDCRDCSRLFE